MGTKTRVATDWGRSQGVYTSLRETARKLPKRLRDIPDKTARKKTDGEQRNKTVVLNDRILFPHFLRVRSFKLRSTDLMIHIFFYNNND